MKVDFLNLKVINQRFEKQLFECYQKVMDSAHYILGENLTLFEQEFAGFCDTQYAVGVGSGLDALRLILEAYKNLGKLKEGDGIAVAANTFIATILAIRQAGLQPVLIEVEPKKFNFSSEDLLKKLTPEVKAIMPVHLYGQLAPMQEIMELADSKSLLVIEDAAQAHGARDKYNRRAGAIGHAAAFSFYPSKNLGALGDAGAITTSDKQLADEIVSLRNYGSSQRYIHEKLGFNSRMDEMQAAFLRIKLPSLDADNQKRQKIAIRYIKEVNNPKILMPIYSGAEDHVFHLFVIQVENRKELMEYLNEKNIGCLIHYPIPPHQQKALIELKNLKLPITERLHQQVLSLPISPVMENEQVEYVIDCLKAY